MAAAWRWFGARWSSPRSSANAVSAQRVWACVEVQWLFPSRAAAGDGAVGAAGLNEHPERQGVAGASASGGRNALCRAGDQPCPGGGGGGGNGGGNASRIEKARVKCLSTHIGSIGTLAQGTLGCFGKRAKAPSKDPERTVLGACLGKVEEKPVVRRGEITVRTILPLTGTFDHRIVDGAQIGKLARGIKRNFRKLEWLDEIPEEELRDCIFPPRD